MTFKKQHFEMSEKLQFEIDFYKAYISSFFAKEKEGINLLFFLRI